MYYSTIVFISISTCVSSGFSIESSDYYKTIIIEEKDLVVGGSIGEGNIFTLHIPRLEITPGEKLALTGQNGSDLILDESTNYINITSVLALENVLVSEKPFCNMGLYQDIMNLKILMGILVI